MKYTEEMFVKQNRETDKLLHFLQECKCICVPIPHDHKFLYHSGKHLYYRHDLFLKNKARVLRKKIVFEKKNKLHLSLTMWMLT